MNALQNLRRSGGEEVAGAMQKSLSEVAGAMLKTLSRQQSRGKLYTKTHVPGRLVLEPRFATAVIELIGGVLRLVGT